VDILSSLAFFRFLLVVWKAEHDNVTAFQLSAGSPAGGVTQLHACFTSRHLPCVSLCSIIVVPCGDEYFHWIYKFGRQSNGWSSSTYCPLLIYLPFPPRPSVDMVVD
jgi:hypothetical protein